MRGGGANDATSCEMREEALGAADPPREVPPREPRREERDVRWSLEDGGTSTDKTANERLRCSTGT
jgi:hypothetical protein